MIALVTGASSGIGKDMAIYLSQLGYDILAIGRDKSKLDELKNEIKTNLHIEVVDLSKQEDVILLHEKVKKEYGEIDVLINCAGFGTFGKFTKTKLETELSMIETNISAVHILMKLFLQDMKEVDHGYILNVASVAGFMPGPLMSTYYATKAYVVRLTQAVYTELKKEKSHVVVSCLCPGPVNTNFNHVANVHFNVSAKESKDVAKYGIDKMFKRKLIMIPGLEIKILRFLAKISPEKLVSSISYHVQVKKEN